MKTFSAKNDIENVFCELCEENISPSGEITIINLSKICLDLFAKFSKDEEQKECFRYLLENGDDCLRQIKKKLQHDSKDDAEGKEKSIFSWQDDIEEIVNEHMRCYRNYVPGLMDAICTLDLEINDFYEKLWDQIASFPWKNQEGIAVACAQIWNDNRIPYNKLGTCCPISKEEINKAKESEYTIQAIEDIRFILSYDYSHAIDEAYQLVNVFTKKSTKAQKSYVMAYLVARLSSNEKE